MSRSIVALAVAIGCAFGGAIYAQTPTPNQASAVKGDNAQTVTFTGCFQNGKQTRSYVLNKAMPMSRTTTETVGTAGTNSSMTTTYMLVPGEKVEFQESAIGHKVEVTGMLVPSGETKTRTETRVDEKPGSVTRETTKTEEAMPQFQVISIKQLAEAC
jgi:hypothetical protein